MLPASRMSRQLWSLLGGLLLLATSALATADSPVLDRVIKAGVLKVGMTGDQPPFNTVSRAGPVIGYDVDLASTLASLMNVELAVVEMPFGELSKALQQGKVDMVMSGMEITPERTQQISFVGPYMLSGKSILTTTAAIERVRTGADLNKPEIRLVALENSTSADFARRNLPAAQVKTVANYDTGIDMLMAGTADAMVADMPVCILSVLRHPNAGLATLDEPLSIAPVGIAIASNDRQFENLLRNYLGTMEKTGVTTNLRQKWFENSGWLAALP